MEATMPFNNIEPSFALIPTHLEYFIDFKRKDFEWRRQELRLLREGSGLED
jgi:hypothetical protein